MHIYGLTGGIASGKSTVTSYLKELNCPIIDADVIAREVVQPGKPAWVLLVQHFGRDILLPDDQINRVKLASIIFSDEKKRHLLNKCTHPYIQRAMLWQALGYFLKGADFVILVSPLLFETRRFLWMLKKTIVVTCSHNLQLERLMKRDNITETAALQKIHAQLPLSTKCKMADLIINNSKSQEETRAQVKQLFENLQLTSTGRRNIRWICLGIFFFVCTLIWIYT